MTDDRAVDSDALAGGMERSIASGPAGGHGHRLPDPRPCGVMPIRARAAQRGLHVRRARGVSIVKGLWPGVKMSRGGEGRVTAGPTGDPWVDSNGWRIRLSAALHPESPIWVDAPPPENFRATAGSYLLAVADSGAYGGRWIVILDSQLAAGICRATRGCAGYLEKFDGGNRLLCGAPGVGRLFARSDRGGDLRFRRRQRSIQPRAAQSAGARRSALPDFAQGRARPIWKACAP